MCGASSRSISKPSAPPRNSRGSGPIVVPETATSSPSDDEPHLDGVRVVARRAVRAPRRPRSRARAAITGALTSSPTWSTRPWNAPFSAAAVRSRVSYSDERAVRGDGDALRRTRPPAPPRARPSFAASGMNGPSTSRSAGVDDRDVDRVRDEPAFERGDDLLGDDHAGAVLRLVGRGGEVRRDDDLVELEQRARRTARPRTRRARRRRACPTGAPRRAPPRRRARRARR